jgi:hypothetical protein
LSMSTAAALIRNQWLLRLPPPERRIASTRRKA